MRRLCEEQDRIAIGDETIGQLLSRVDPIPDDGPWPRPEVCEVLERIATRAIGEGFCVGVCNARGAHMREEGGDQERRLAATFRRLGKQHEFDFPFVANLLEEIASDYDREAKWHDTREDVRKRLD